MFQPQIQKDCEMSKFKFCLSHCLTWYCAMDGPILIRSIMLWNHIAWTQWPIGSVAVITRHMNIGYDATAMMLPWALSSSCRSTGVQDPRRQLYRDNIVSTMRRTNSSSNPQSTIIYTEDDLKILFRFLSTNSFKTTSLYHPHDHALYVWTQIDTIAIRTPKEHWTFRPSYFWIGRATVIHITLGV